MTKEEYYDLKIVELEIEIQGYTKTVEITRDFFHN